MSSTNVDILKSLCRLCAKQDKHCVNVFSSDGNKHFIQKKIRLCLPIRIKENDVMPRQICLSCLNKLDTCYELYSGCVSAQSTIKKLIESPEEDEVSITAISYPNPLIKVRKAVGSDSPPGTPASSPISLHDFLKQDCSQPVTNKIDPDNTQQKPANEDNETTPKFQRLADSGFPRIKIRKLDADIRIANESVDRGNDQRKSTGTVLANSNSLSTASVLTTVEKEASSSNSMPAMNVPIMANAITTDLSSNQNHPLHNITNLQSLAKPVSCTTSSAPTTIMNSDSGGYQMATQSMTNMQSPQNIYITPNSDGIVNPCTQMASTYVASQTLVRSPLMTSAYITAAPSNANPVTQTITPNYLIQQQPVNSGVTPSDTLVYVNTVADLLPQNTSQHISYTVTPATLNNNNLLLTHNLQKQQSSSLNSDESRNFNQLAPYSTTAGKTLTTATSSNFVSHTPVISNVHSVPLKAYERVCHMSDASSQNVAAKSSIRNNGSVPIKTYDRVCRKLDAVSQIVPAKSSIRNNGNSSPGVTLNAGNKHMSNDILSKNLLNSSSNSETYNPNIKNGNVGKKIINNSNCNCISELNSQVSIHVPNTNASRNDSSTTKSSNNKLATVMANNLKSVISPQTGPKEAAPPAAVFFGQKRTVAARRSVNNPQQPHVVATSRTSVDGIRFPVATNSQATNGSSVGQAAVSNRVYTHIYRPAASPAVPSPLPRNSPPVVIRKTSPCPSSASKSQASLLPTTSAGTTTASPMTPVNSVSNETLVLVAGLKQENQTCPTRTLKQQADSSAVVASTDSTSSSTDCTSSSTDSSGVSSENGQKRVPRAIGENTCPYCLRDFPPDVLIHHKVLHFREKFFSCLDCNKNFKTEEGLQKHRCEVA